MKTSLSISDIPRYCGNKGETIQLSDALQIRIKTEHDDFIGAPWKEFDYYGIVSDWTSRDKRSGERVLCSERQRKLYYDFEATIQKAKDENWG